MVRFIIWLRPVESIRYSGNYMDIKVITVPRVETAGVYAAPFAGISDESNEYIC